MPSNPGRGTQNSESQRRGSSNATSSRTQGKNPTSTSSRNVGRSASTASTQRQSQSSTTKSRGATGTTQTARATSRPGQVDETQAQRTQSRPTTGTTSSKDTASTNDTSIANSMSATDSMSTAGREEPTSTAQADREMPVQSSRETEDITQRDVGQRSAGQSMSRGQQSSPVFGGYGGATGNPFVAIRRMMEDMDRIVSNLGFGAFLTPSLLQEQFGIGSQRSAGAGMSTLWNPQIDINRRGENLVICADLPGIKKEDVSVEIDRNVLTIRGERKNDFEDESEGFFRSERSYGSFQRSIPLPEGVTAENAQASFNNGVLEVRIPVPRNQAGSKRIEIR